MADREDIIELINLYGFAMDTQCWDLFDRIFTEDVDADYGPTSHWTDRAQFKSDFGSFHELFDATQHVMTNHLVKVDGDRAASHTYGAWRLIRHAAGDPPVWDGTGWYDDQWVRTSEGWRISKRVCGVVYWTGNPRVQTPMEEIEFKLDLVSMRTEGAEGRLNFLKAINLMAKMRDAIRMTEGEIVALLDECKSLQVATLDKDGAPHLTTVWFAYRDGTYLFETYGKSQKVVNLRRDPRVAVLAEQGTSYDQLRGVSIRGQTEIVDGGEPLQALMEVIVARNHRGLDAGEVTKIAASMAEKRVVVIVRPDKVISWDHRKLGIG